MSLLLTILGVTVFFSLAAGFARYKIEKEQGQAKQ
jgi:hypothetical protein